MASGAWAARHPTESVCERAEALLGVVEGRLDGPPSVRFL